MYSVALAGAIAPLVRDKEERILFDTFVGAAICRLSRGPQAALWLPCAKGAGAQRLRDCRNPRSPNIIKTCAERIFHYGLRPLSYVFYPAAQVIAHGVAMGLHGHMASGFHYVDLGFWHQFFESSYGFFVHEHILLAP